MNQQTKQSIVNLVGVPISPLTVDELHQKISCFIENGSKANILHANVHAINLAYQNSWLRSFFSSADIVFCDGAGVILGARILGNHIPQRITYADWLWQLADFSAEHGFSLFLLGARPGISEIAAKNLTKRFPNLKIAGTHHGYFDKAPQSNQNIAVIEKINQTSPDILLVCFGMPLQERWLQQNFDRLQVHVVLTGGAALDYVSGELKRAPQWMTNHGFEWLGRLLIEPKRLWRRYIMGNPIFLGRVIKQRLGLLHLDPIQDGDSPRSTST